MSSVSVVIPTYNHQGYVLDALESVFAQSFTDYEVIVVNDGSPDDTAAVLRPLAVAGRIRYIEQPNAGQAAARNRGIAECRGRFVALLDDDDLWPADKLQWQVGRLSAAPDAVMVWGEAVSLQTGERIGDNENLGARWQGPRVIHDCLIRSPGQTLIRRSALARVGGFDERLWGTDDFDVYIRLADLGPFLYVPRTALRYRWHGGNASRNSERMHDNKQILRRKHAAAVRARVAPPPAARPDRRQLHQDHLWLAWYFFLEGRFADARRHYGRAAALDPAGFIKTGIWRQAAAACLPDVIRPWWRRRKERRPRERLRVSSGSPATG